MNKKKKIVFLVTQSEFGGAQRFIYTLIEGMRRYTQINPRQVGDTQIDADKGDFLYSDITYKIRGACFKIWKEFRGAFKEKIIERALAKELQNQGLIVDTQKQILVLYDNEKIGKYIPDMVVNDKIIVELKSKTFLTKEDEKQFWLYLKGSEYRLGLLINFGRKLEIKRKIYDTARDGFQRKSAIDYEVVVGAGPEGDDKNGLLHALENKRINTKHLKYLRRSVNPFFDILGYFEIKKLLKKQKPDVLFLCSSKAGFLGSLAARRYKRIVSEQSPEHAETRRNFQRESAYSSEARSNQRLSAKSPKVIYRIGGWTFNDPWPKWKKRLYIWIEKFSAKYKDYIINNAESDRRQAIELGIKPGKEILVIYNGIGDLKFLSRQEARQKLIHLISNSPNSPNPLRQSFSEASQIPSPNDQIVGCIANYYPSKGLKYLIETMKEIDAKLVIIGKGNTYIPDAYKYLKAFDVFVLPSVKEGFPWTILEAIKAEIPIVATCVGAIPEIINKCVEPGNVKELIKAIKNPKKFKFNKKFSLEVMVEQFEKLFNA